MNDEVSPCPFCGKPFQVLGDDEWGGWFYTHDSDCILVTPIGDTHRAWLEKQDVIDALNRRPNREAA